MSLIDSFKLEKLKIIAYRDAARRERAGDFEAMFNPEEIKQAATVIYGSPGAAGASDDQSAFQRIEPQVMTLDLILDGTGVTNNVRVPPGPAAKTVSERVEEFLTLACRVNADTHRPNYLEMRWGGIWSSTGFKCVLASFEITYSRFQRDGKPLRAKLNVSLRSDKPWDEQVREINPSSPDLTHRHVLRAGESLPHLVERIYGSAEHVAMVARANGLNGLRMIPPGTELAFPPLERPGRERER